MSNPAYPIKAPKTKRMQVITQAEMDVSPSTFGELLVMFVKMLIKTRNKVTSKVIRPGTISGGIRKLTLKTQKYICSF